MSFIYWTSFQTFVLFEFFSNVWIFCTSCGQWKSIQFLRVTVRTAKYDSYLIQLMLVSILGTRFKVFNFSPSMNERLGGQVVRRRSRKATLRLPWQPKIAGSNPVRAFFFSNFFLFFIRTVFFLLFFPLLSKKNPIIFNIPFRINFIQCRPKKWKKKKKTKKKLSKTPIFKSELIILKRAIDLTFCQTP